MTNNVTTTPIGKKSRIFLLTFFLLLKLTSVSSQVIHSIIFADTYNRAIGGSCQQDLNNIRGFISDLGKALGKNNIDEHVYSNDRFTVANFINCPQDIKSNPGDIIFLYVTSHGDRSAKATTEFPEIIFDNIDTSAFNLYLKLSTMPHSTCIGVIDACNAYNNLSAGELKNIYKGPSSLNLAPDNHFVSENVKNVFLNNPFNLLITGSQTGVLSITNPNGSLFTVQFVKYFDYFLNLNKPEVVQIDNILDKIKHETLNESSRQVYNDHLNLADPKNVPYYPLWRICSKGVFPCVNCLHYRDTTESPDLASIEVIDNSTLDKLLNLQNAAFSSSQTTSAYSFESRTKDVDLERAEVTVSERVNEFFNSKLRFSIPTNIKGFKVEKKDFVADITPNQFVIEYQVVPLNADLKSKFNTSDGYLTTLHIIAPEALLQKIESVEYYLDPDSTTPIIAVKDRGSNYNLSIPLNGNFFLIAKVNFSDHTYVNISKELIINNK